MQVNACQNSEFLAFLVIDAHDFQTVSQNKRKSTKSQESFSGRVFVNILAKSIEKVCSALSTACHEVADLPQQLGQRKIQDIFGIGRAASSSHQQLLTGWDANSCRAVEAAHQPSR